MNDHDFEQAARVWLDEGPTTMPDRGLQAALDEIHVTRQRRAFVPARRFNTVGNILRFAALTAAIVLASVAGLTRLSPNSGVGASEPPSPSSSPSPSASPMALPNVGSSTPVSLTAGTYSLATDPSRRDDPLMTFTVPAGWSTHEAFVDKSAGTQQEVMFTIWVVTDVFKDACHWDEQGNTLISGGSTPADLVNVLSQQLGRTASTSTDVTVGGYPAKVIELTVPADLDTSTCTRGFLRFWPNAGPDLSGGLCCDLAGNIDDVYAIDLNGHTLAMIARHYPGSSDADKAELQAIVDSVQFSTPPASPSPSSASSPGASGSAPSPSPAAS
jgi:hypothetical protein